MNINARYLKWLVVLLPIACSTYAAPLTLNSKITFQSNEGAFLNATIQDAGGPTQFFYRWIYTGTESDRSRINIIDGTSEDIADETGWGLYLDTNQGKLSVRTADSDDPSVGVAIADMSDNYQMTDPSTKRWISMDVRFAPSDVLPDLATFAQEGTVQGARLAVCAAVTNKVDDTSVEEIRVFVAGYDDTYTVNSDMMRQSPKWIDTGYVIENPADLYTLQIAIKGYRATDFTYTVQTMYRLSIIKDGTVECITAGKGWTIPDTAAGMSLDEYSINPASFVPGGEWIAGLNAPIFNEKSGVYYPGILQRVQFEGTGFIDNLELLSTDPTPDPGGDDVEIPTTWPDGVDQDKFNTWAKDNYPAPYTVPADALNAYLLNVSPTTSPMPELKITSVAVTNSVITVKIAAGGVNLTNINGTLCVQTTNSLTNNFSNLTSQGIIVSTDAPAVATINAPGAKFVKATVEVTDPDAAE